MFFSVVFLICIERPQPEAVERLAEFEKYSFFFLLLVYMYVTLSDV
jgi:hypothetical protein